MGLGLGMGLWLGSAPVVASGGGGGGGILSDDFADGTTNPLTEDGPIYTSATTQDGTVVEGSGVLTITPPTSAAGLRFNGRRLVTATNLRGKRISAKMTINSSAGAFEAALSVGLPDTVWHCLWDSSLLFLQKRTSSSSTSNIGNFAYNATTHAYVSLRIGNTGDDTVYLDTSTDGSTWTNRLSAAFDGAIDLTAAKAGIQAGTYSSEATPGNAVFDNWIIA